MIEGHLHAYPYLPAWRQWLYPPYSHRREGVNIGVDTTFIALARKIV